MDIIDLLKTHIKQAIPSKFKNITELADKAGVNQPNLSELLNGKRKSLKLETAWKIMRVLDLGISCTEDRPTIRHMGENSQAVAVDGTDVLPIAVFAVAGAGLAWDIKESAPIYSITAPPSFASQSSFALLIDGESMYPTIKNGAVVGVSDDTRFRQNEIFAINIPYEGLAIKRVAIDHANSQYVLRSDNPDKGKYHDIRIFIEEAPNLIIGRVVWVWQGV